MNINTFPRKLIIIGTEKSVGKSFVAATLMMGLKALYWKPIQCGISPCTDTEWIHETTALPAKHFLRESYLYHKETPPYAQHTQVDLETLHPSLSSPYEHMIIEGPGGIMVPLNEEDHFLDFIKQINTPVMIVMSENSTCIDHAILTIEKLKEENIPIFAIVINKSNDIHILDTIKHYSEASHLFQIDLIEQITEKSLLNIFTNTFLKVKKNKHCPDLTLRNKQLKVEEKLKYVSV